MNAPGRGRRRHFFLFLALLVLAAIGAPAARGDAADAEPSAAQVAEGLKTIQDIAADTAAAAGKDKAKAEKIDEGIEAVWSKIEDMVRGNDKDVYITFEDSFESLASAAKAGDATKAAKAYEAIGVAVKAYVAKHPADAPAPAPSAVPAPGPRSAAAEAGDATLARTGGASSALAALAGVAFALGGLALMASARRPVAGTA